MTLQRVSQLLVRGALALGAGLMAAAALAQTGPIKIGGSMPLTGGNASIGKVAQATAKIWLDEVNARGGLPGAVLDQPEVMKAYLEK